MYHIRAARNFAGVHDYGLLMIGLVSHWRGSEPINSTILLDQDAMEGAPELSRATNVPTTSGIIPTFNISSTLWYVILSLFLLMIIIILIFSELLGAWKTQFNDNMY